MTNRVMHLSNGLSYTAELTVYRDYIESNGQWRLFWLNPETEACGLQEQSTVTGRPFFHTMKAAIAYGIKHYGLTAKKVVF